MDSNKKVKYSNILSLIFNISIVIFVIFSVGQYFVTSGVGNMEISGIACLRYYTNLSNILVGIPSAILIPYTILSIKNNKHFTPNWLTIFKFIATVSVTVTFLTVIFFLGPTQGYKLMFAGNCLFLHLITPFFAIISFTMFEAKSHIKLKVAFLGVSSTLLYSIVYCIWVVILAQWPDFYGFTFGGKLWAIPIAMVVMYIATFIFGLGLILIQNIINTKLFSTTVDVQSDNKVA